MWPEDEVCLDWGCFLQRQPKLHSLIKGQLDILRYQQVSLNNLINLKKMIF